MLLFILLTVGLLAWAGTRLIISRAMDWGLQDIPNHRSSHVLPTPRGGGAAIVIASLIGFVLLATLPPLVPAVTGSLWPAPVDTPAWAMDAVHPLRELEAFAPPGIIMLTGALALAVTGLYDDLRPLSIRQRLLVQASAVGWLLIFCLYQTLGGEAVFWQGIDALWQSLPLSGTLTEALASGRDTLPILLAGGVFTVLLAAGIWWVNLFNFMDGIDGIAASQAVFMLGAGVLLRALPTGIDPAASAGAPVMHALSAQTGLPLSPMVDPLSVISLIIACATTGFLVLNWAPARIFMGDAGSLFLGFTILAIGAFDIATQLIARHGAAHDGLDHLPAVTGNSLWVWLILGALFITDATVTLIRRLLSGQNVGDAHRSHAYQRLSRRLGSHARATLVYCLINIAWILPLAWAARHWPESAAPATALAYGPLLVCAWLLGAGRKETAS
ncbi:MAG: hypothetical protein Q4A16_11220 [Lautropia sp.]|nr:hypothetical protein [Lautropia sp.]